MGENIEQRIGNTEKNVIYIPTALWQITTIKCFNLECNHVLKPLTTSNTI